MYLSADPTRINFNNESLLELSEVSFTVTTYYSFPLNIQQESFKISARNNKMSAFLIFFSFWPTQLVGFLEGDWWSVQACHNAEKIFYSGYLFWAHPVLRGTFLIHWKCSIRFQVNRFSSGEDEDSFRSFGGDLKNQVVGD